MDLFLIYFEFDLINLISKYFQIFGVGVTMRLETVDRSWTYSVCESCLRNAHEKHEMQKEFLIDTNDANDESKKVEVLVCPACGSTRRL